MSAEEVEFDDGAELDDEQVQNSAARRSFTSKDIKVNTSTIALSAVISRLNNDAIDLQPNFQRKAGLWDNTQMSRLIESIILQMPLPNFYFDVANPERWLVVDGLQRLSTIKKFVVDKQLKLVNLEFLTEYEGQTFSDLPRPIQRIIEQTQISTCQIEPQTSKEVRYSIFNRINTGGIALNRQEIRQGLNQEGIAVEFLQKVCNRKVFKSIVQISSNRSLDCELVLRFFAFRLLPLDDFKSLSLFLDRAIETIDQYQQITPELDCLAKEFEQALILSNKLLGKGHKFSRALAIGGVRQLNRSLFDVLTVCLSEVKDTEQLLRQQKMFKQELVAMITNEQSEFCQGITKGTATKQAVMNRFTHMRKLLKKIEMQT